MTEEFSIQPSGPLGNYLHSAVASRSNVIIRENPNGTSRRSIQLEGACEFNSGSAAQFQMPITINIGLDPNLDSRSPNQNQRYSARIVMAGRAATTEALLLLIVAPSDYDLVIHSIRRTAGNGQWRLEFGTDGQISQQIDPGLEERHDLKGFMLNAGLTL